MEYKQFVDESDLESTRSTEEARRAYISEIIEVAAGDARNLVVMATVAVGIVVFLLKDSAGAIRGLGAPFAWLAALAVGTLLLAAGLMFWYAAHINRRRMSLARCLATSDAEKARDLWAGSTHGIRAEHGKILNGAMGLTIVGLALSAIVAAALLLH